MSWSLGEVQALAVKAARGAGYPWGLAEEAGFAVRWLSAQGLPGPAAMAALLRMVDDGGLQPSRCPLARGARLSDTAKAPAAPLGLGRLRLPLLLVPFAANLRPQGPLCVTWEGAGISIEPGRVAVSGTGTALLAPEADCTLRPGAMPGAVPCSPRTRIPADCAPEIAALAGFAARTYAPATEASRLAGAGAGTTDND